MFTTRISAIKLLCRLYQHTGKAQPSLKTLFFEIAKEDTPMVRRAIASNLL